MVLIFDLTERHLIVRMMTDKEFDCFQELNSKYVKAWTEAEVFLRKMVEKYIDSPNTISSDVIWVCDSCGKQCKTDDERNEHARRTNPRHELYTPNPEIREPMF